MPRKPRVEFAGAVYHVMCRGDHREAIFLDDADREMFLATLTEAGDRTGWRLHAYVLMGNHYHLLLETPEPNLVAGMRWFQGTYTIRFNHRHGLSGHLFQGRYKALPVAPEEDGYLLRVSTYIHLNPARAKLIKGREKPLSSFPWSSYPVYVESPRKRPAMVRVARVLGALEIKDTPQGRRRYAVYMEGRRQELFRRAGRTGLDEEWQAIRRGWYLGPEAFGERVRQLVDKGLAGKARNSFSGLAAKAHDTAAAKQMLRKGLRTLGLRERDLTGLPKLDSRKQVLAWYVRKQAMVSNQWVSDALCMGHAGNISKVVRAVEGGTSGPLRLMKRRLMNDV